MPVPHEELLEALGSSSTNEVVARLRRLAHMPPIQLENLARAALNENWGEKLLGGHPKPATSGHLKTGHHGA